jgi:hypothetical protein
LIVSVNEAKGGSFPPYSVWIGNLVLVLCGLGLMQAVAHDRDKLLSALGSVFTTWMPWGKKS